MKSWQTLLSIGLCLGLLAGCGADADGPCLADPAKDPAATELAEYPTLTCRIVDGAEEGDLLLAELSGSGVYRIAVTEETPVTLDGEPASAADLEDGMPVTIKFDGQVQESYPAGLGEIYGVSAWSLGTEQNPGGGYYDLCGLYLQVLEDLWEVDSGLNGGVEILGLDLSRAPGGLTESEQAALAWRFGELRGLPVVTGTYEELVEQGYITGEPLEGTDAKFWQWEDGILFTIEVNEDHEGEAYSLPILFFNASKWRSGLGAYFFHDCSCLWPESGSWSTYSVGSEMIS